MCGCTYERACPAGCAWAGNQDLCTVCAGFMQQLAEYVEYANRVTKASLGRMLDEVYPIGKPVKRKAARA